MTFPYVFKKSIDLDDTNPMYDYIHYSVLTWDKDVIVHYTDKWPDRVMHVEFKDEQQYLLFALKFR